MKSALGRQRFGAAVEASRGKGDFAPWWMYPGSSRIHRVLTNFPLSIDESRYAQLKRDLVLYRLTLGQPRQEDMLELLAARGVTGHEVPSIDLSAPRNWLGSRAGEDVHEQTLNRMTMMLQPPSRRPQRRSRSAGSMAVMQRSHSSSFRVS